MILTGDPQSHINCKCYHFLQRKEPTFASPGLDLFPITDKVPSTIGGVAVVLEPMEISAGTEALEQIAGWIPSFGGREQVEGS